MNLFASVLTYASPSANYRGESAQNRSIIQKITYGRFEYAVISPEAMRNGLRETIVQYDPSLPLNRSRLDDEEQLAVSFKDYNDPDKYFDDFFFGYLIAASGKDREAIRKEMEKRGRDTKNFTFKRDSILRMNLAVALEPYRHNSVFSQSPKDMTSKDKKSHTNADSSMLLHRELSYTAFQYPFALNLTDCKPKKQWTQALLKAMAQLSDVSGNHARSYFEMAPASIVMRLTKRLAAGFDVYGFEMENKKHHLPKLLDSLLHDDLPGNEFYLGGQVVKDMEETTKEKLKEKEVTLDRDAARLLESLADEQKLWPS